MSAYKVAISPHGDPIWWVGYEMASADLSQYSNIRDATPEEAALMERVVWDRHTDADCKMLKALIAAPTPS